MPWRKEIEEGIRDSAKTVLFVDRAYLLSFNCLQVCAFGLPHHRHHHHHHLRLFPSVPSSSWVLCSSVTITDGR